MPFSKPFRDIFCHGDLIYGLTDQRNNYINHPKFEIAKVNFCEQRYPPVVIDNYLLPIDKQIITEFMIIYNTRVKENDWENADEKEYYREKMENYYSRVEYIKKPEYKEYETSFWDHLKEHYKYRTTLDENSNMKANLNLGRKCKGGLSWVSMSNSDLTRNMHIHFILDDINMDRVVNKRDYNITGKELRWLYRNRHEIRVAQQVQFWKDGTPTSPPWETEEALWENYRYMENYSGEFSQLFNTL
ncbi:hypothetical protein [Xenorhabdus bharatensis]|uniref:hypothetical protein n=1 Tax=Xenorhabdus bharatensis TaxID=3136256 RepID=UPI0030F3ABE8